MGFEISGDVLNRFRDEWMKSMQADPREEDPERIADRAGLAAVLSMPEVRQAIYEDVRRESDAELKSMGVTGYSVGWDR